MQKNQTRSYEERCATGLFVLHLLRALGGKELLIASAGYALRVRCFCLRGKEFSNVIQFIT
jgi:hypothetical protein